MCVMDVLCVFVGGSERLKRERERGRELQRDVNDVTESKRWREREREMGIEYIRIRSLYTVQS